MNKPLLTFEMNESDECLEIHGDVDGLSALIACIQKTIADKDHQHLMTEAWGGSELSSEQQGANNKLVNHVRISEWSE